MRCHLNPALLKFVRNTLIILGFTVSVSAKPCWAQGSSTLPLVTPLGPAGINGEDAHLGYDINAATGNLFLVQSDALVHVALGPDLQFMRYYNSLGGGRDVGLGPNWTHSYSWSLQYGADVSGAPQALITADTGQKLLFGFNAQSSSWTPPPGEFGSLAGSTGANWVYTNKYGTQYSFDSSGRLTEIKPADNSPITIQYTTGTEIKSVTSGNPAKFLEFSYSDGHIESIRDPANFGWTYGYTPVTLSFASGQTPITQSGTGLLQFVRPPTNVPPGSLNPLTLYSYSLQNIGSKEFSAGKIAAQLTAYAVVTSGTALNVQETILGLFAYSNPAEGPSNSVVSEAASGVVNENEQFLKDVQLKYSLVPGGRGITTNALLNGGIKSISSAFPAGDSSSYSRLVSISSTAGSGASGEIESEAWSWNSNLTLAQHTDGNGNTTAFGSYDGRGNPRVITEAYGTSVARTTTVEYHPFLSTPILITRPSVSQVAGQEHTLSFNYTRYTAYGTNLNYHLTQISDTGYTNSNLQGALGQKPESNLTTLTYDPNDRLIGIAGPNPGALTNFDYSPSTGYLSSGFGTP